jgi:hypothetical protein
MASEHDRKMPWRTVAVAWLLMMVASGVLSTVQAPTLIVAIVLGVIVLVLGIAIVWPVYLGSLPTDA